MDRPLPNRLPNTTVTHTKLTRLLSKSTEKDMEMNKFVTKAKTTDTMLQRRHRTALLLAETLDDLSNKEQQEIKGLGDGDDQKLTKDSEALLAVLATACQVSKRIQAHILIQIMQILTDVLSRCLHLDPNHQTIINLNGRMSTLPALPDPSSGTGVFLGGSCNPTTWRTDIAIPSFAKHGIKYYNPQVLTQYMLTLYNPQVLTLYNEACSIQPTGAHTIQ
jgi:hypothetical protein